MKLTTPIAVLLGLLLTFGCQTESTVVESDSSFSPSSDFVNQIVEAACGQCQFDMEGSGCDLAIRIDGKSYYVDGTLLDDHGDAHADNGLCNCVRQAKVTGEINEGRFVSNSFELLPTEKSQ